MQKFRLTLELLSPLGTPLMGDTLFGHVCWGIVNHEGEYALNEFLEAYEAGEPPMVISNVFPEGMLPAPKLKPAFPDPLATGDEVIKLKELKRVNYIPYNLFDGAINEKNLIKSDEKKNLNRFISEMRNRNTINRFSGNTAGDQGLYSVQEFWLGQEGQEDENRLVEVYIFSNLTEKRIYQLMVWAFECGFGADSSIGRGRVQFNKDCFEVCELPEVGNRALALGHFVMEDYTGISDLRADNFTRFGKVGGWLGQQIKPFKKPIVMFAEGASFILGEKKDYVGCILKNIHNDNRIRHHAFAPVIYYNETEGEV